MKKITIKMPNISVSYDDDKYKKQAKIMAELLEYQIKKPEFIKKLDDIVDELAISILELLK